MAFAQEPAAGAVFSGGDSDWGLRVEVDAADAGSATYYTFVPQLFGVLKGRLQRDDDDDVPGRVRYTALMRIDGSRPKTYLIVFTPATSGEPCLDSDMREYDYAVTASVGPWTWNGCGDFNDP
ncbi:MAG: hypothetical protein E6Q88_04040 [Lysobacteraceae bacterium]|nr:MAG: hypothetical protein E6Q88_04040 [Xanthomonadaceae bacterium]